MIPSLQLNEINVKLQNRIGVKKLHDKSKRITKTQGLSLDLKKCTKNNVRKQNKIWVECPY